VRRAILARLDRAILDRPGPVILARQVATLAQQVETLAQQVETPARPAETLVRQARPVTTTMVRRAILARLDPAIPVRRDTVILARPDQTTRRVQRIRPVRVTHVIRVTHTG
jgi:hypothetical protein